MAETDSDKELNLAGLKGIDTSNPEGNNPEGEPETNPILQSSKDKIKSSDSYIKPKSKDSAFRNNLANSAVTGITNDTIIGSNLMVDKKLASPLFTPIDLALAIPDPRERAKYIKEHGSNMTQLLDPDVYGILFNRDVADYAQYRKKSYNNKLKTFVDDLDNNQGFWESMGIVSAKLGGDVVNNLGANLVAPVYGLGAALFNWGDTGKWDSSKIYDNDVTDYFKKNLEYLDNELVIYGGTGYGKDKEKADKINDALSGGVLRGTGDFFSRVTTHPFKSINEDIVPTISFVAAAVGSEMILKRVGLTGGGFIGNNLARAGAYGVKGFSKGYRVIRGLDKLSDIQAMRRVITTADRIKKTAGTIGTMYRSAAYESGMIGQDVQDNTLLEAKFGYIKKNPELFAEYNRLVRENTTEFGVLTADNAKLIEQVALRIPKGELAVMANTSKNAGTAAFLTNIPLVGASYMIQFPKVFGAGYRNSQKILSKTGTLYGTTKGVSGKLTSNFSKAAWYEKLAYKYILPGATSGITEGFEEFSQGVIEKGYTDYWASPYTKNSTESSISFLSAMSNASRKYAKSVEGQDSMTLGFLMGVLGIPMFKASSNKAGFKVGWSGGAYEAVQEVKDKISEVELAITKYNEGVQTNDVLKNNFDSFRKSISIEENSDRALEEGDVFAYKNAEHDALHNYVTNRINNGILDTVYQDIEGLEEMSLEEFNEQFAHKDEAFQFTEKTKKKNLETLKNNVDAIANSVDTVEKVFNDKRVWVDKFFNKNYKGLDPILKDDILDELTDNTGAFKNKNLESYVKQNPEEAFAIKHFIQSKQTLLKEKAIYLLSSKNNLQKREKQLKERLNELVPNANLDALYKDENYKEVLAAIEKGDQIYFAEEEGKKKLSSFIKEITGQIKEDNFKEYNFNKDEIDGIVNDIFKIRTTEAKVSEIYSTLFTNKGANNWLKLKSSLEEQYVELILENQEKILKEQAERVQDASSLKTILNLYKELFGTELPAHSDNIKKQLNTLKEKIDPENLVYEDIVAGLKDFKNPNLIEHIFDLLQKQNKLPQKIEYTIDKIDLVKNDQDFKNDFLEAFETILNNYESIIDDINSILDAANKNKDNRQTPSQKPYTKAEQKEEELASMNTAMDSVFEQIAKKNNIGFIPIFHDKELLIDTDNRVLGVRHKISGSKRGPALKTINGKENTQPKIKGYNTKVINSANDLNNKYLQENVVYASFKFATETNEKGNSYGDKTVYDADSIGIDVYIGDLFVGKVPTTGNSPSSKALRAALFNGTVNEDGTIIGTESTTTTQEYTGYESTATVAPKTETKETTTSDLGQTSEVELNYSPVNMSGYGKSYKQADISEGGKSIIFNSHRKAFKIKDGVLTANIDDIDGKTFYPISVDVSNTPEYLDYKEKKYVLDAERKRLKEAGEKGIEDMLKGMGASMSVAKKQVLDLLHKELSKKNSITPFKGGTLSKPTQQTSEVELNKWKRKDIEDLFDENPSLKKIGSVEEYNAYLKSVFPNSKVDYFLYHGTDVKFDVFDKSRQNKNTDPNFISEGFWFTRTKERARDFGSNVKIVVLNQENPYKKSGRLNEKGFYEYADQVDDIKAAKKAGNDSAILDINEGGLDGDAPVTEHVVFEPKQIHELGSKKDIQGFKDFVGKPTQTTSPETEVEQSVREKVIDKNFKDIIKALTANPIMQGDEFIGKKKC